MLFGDVVNVHGRGVVNVHDGRPGKPTHALTDCQLGIGVAGPAGGATRCESRWPPGL